MTTWCRPDSTVSPDRPSNNPINRFAPGKRTGSNGNTKSGIGSYLIGEHPSLVQLQREVPQRRLRAAFIGDRRPASSPPVRHSIADILGWVEASKEAAAAAAAVDDEDYAAAVMMASDFVDMAGDVAYSDEPLDLSLDKSKSRKDRTASDFERHQDAMTPIKRAKYHQEVAASDAGTDDGDAGDAASAWTGAGIVQPHLQMAANFSTVLQYYLTAARLWQTSEAMRCHESQQPDGEAPEEPEAPAGDPAAAVVAAMAAAAAAAANAAVASDPPPPVASPALVKKRKKEAPGDAAPAPADASGQNGPMRPRKTRTTFTGKQLFELERIFEQKKYLSSNERQEVARLLNVTGSQVKFEFLPDFTNKQTAIMK